MFEKQTENAVRPWANARSDNWYLTDGSHGSLRRTWEFHTDTHTQTNNKKPYSHQHTTDRVCWRWACQSWTNAYELTALKAFSAQNTMLYVIDQHQPSSTELNNRNAVSMEIMNFENHLINLCFWVIVRTLNSSQCLINIIVLILMFCNLTNDDSVWILGKP